MTIRGLVRITPLLVTLLLSGQTPTQRGLVGAGDNVSFLSPNRGNMRWTANHLAGCDYCDGAPILWIVDRLGNRQTVAFSITGADYVRVADLASGPDGSLTAVGNAISGSARMGTFIAWIFPDKARQVVTRVWPYAPNVVTVAPDGSVWTVGAVMKDDYRGEVQYNALRHYTPAGKLLVSTHIRGARCNSGGMYRVSDTSLLMSSQDRIGWLTNACQHIEFSFEAVQLGTYNCPNGYTTIAEPSGIALSSPNDLLIGGRWLAPLAPLELDRTSNTWRPVTVSEGSVRTKNLLGFDGLTLVTASTSSSMRRYNWSSQPTSGGQ
jgi:hypothetical protein